MIKKMNTTKIVTANIGRNIGAGGVEADYRAILNEAPQGIIGFQEIDEADPANEHGLLQDAFEQFEIVNFSSRVPLAVHNRFDLTKTDDFRLSPGVKHASPPRVATDAWLEIDGEILVVINFHLIAGAWNAKIESNQQIRREYWWDAVDKLKARIEWHIAHGRTVVWMGDVNRMDMVKLHRRERQLVTPGIDSISVVESRLKAKVREKGTIKLNSDHDADFVVIEWKKRRQLSIR